MYPNYTFVPIVNFWFNGPFLNSCKKDNEIQKHWYAIFNSFFKIFDYIICSQILFYEKIESNPCFRIFFWSMWFLFFYFFKASDHCVFIRCYLSGLVFVIFGSHVWYCESRFLNHRYHICHHSTEFSWSKILHIWPIEKSHVLKYCICVSEFSIGTITVPKKPHFFKKKMG